MASSEINPVNPAHPRQVSRICSSLPPITAFRSAGGCFDANTPLPTLLDQHRLLNVRQVAEVLGFSVAHVRRLYRTGKLPKPKVIGGRKVSWPASTILALISSPKEAA